ncbi:protein takeout-like [Pectinophora gossypiella]|uniref:protein takeout-like n=1 Tax=Pectinophora gossypiella TaxID=13191 RepID=UPI00214F2A1F|nr:protein takeout-like [Pectinophora gossypiella]
MFRYYLVAALCIAFGVSYSHQWNMYIPCKKGDKECVMQSAKLAYSKLMPGIPALGVESSDPLYQPEISGGVSVFNYEFKDTIITGFANCDILEVNVNTDEPCFHIELMCTNMTLKGQYSIKGELLNANLHEAGTYDILCHKYKLGLRTKIVDVENDGKTYLQLNELKPYGNIEGKVIYKLTTLAGKMSTLQPIMNLNWKLVTNYLQDSVIGANMKLLAGHANKFLKSISVQELFLQQNPSRNNCDAF